MSRILHISLILISALRVHAQNIIPNPGFEDVNICTEYNYPCAPSAWQSVSPNTSKLMYAGDKNNRHITLTMHSSIDPLFHTYAQTTLLCPLKKGESYKLSIYVAVGDGQSPFPDVRFDTAAVLRWSSKPLLLPASLHFTPNDSKGRKNKWTLLEKTFVAKSNATQLIIGNLDTTLVNYHDKAEYYLTIDSISLTPLSGKICADTKITAAKLYAFHDRHHFVVPYKTIDAPNPIAPKHPQKQTVFYTKGTCDTLRLKNDFFLPKSRKINPDYQVQLENALKQPTEIRAKIKLTGYVFSNASEKYNEIMAQDRAQAVASYLVYQKGFSFDDFIINGVGKPARGADSSERVELINCQPGHEITVSVIRTDTLLIPDILFRFNSHELNNATLNTLDSLTSKIPTGDNISITITGHTDNTGSIEYNQELSMRRAFTVADYIRDKKPGSNITAVNGMGESIPVADNHTAAGRRRNRRVEIVIYHLSR